MEKTVTRIPAIRKTEEIQNKKKVCAYARVSTNHVDQLNSYRAQITYYDAYIKSRPDWEYAGVYADEGITGTLVKKRSGFQKMVSDALDGKIDLIITKSISRFARNTVDLLSSVRLLREHGVEVFFEKENISTLDTAGEFVLTCFASLAQEEVRNLSANVRWARRKKIEAGELPIRMQVTGYKWEGDNLVIDEDWAWLVKRIFSEYMDGKSPGQICKSLRADGIKTIRGHWFQEGPIYKILRNPLYKGDLLLQKTYVVDPIRKVTKWNRGELSMIYVEENHDPIIDKVFFDAVQDEMKRRKERWIANDFEFEGMGDFCRRVKCGDSVYYHSAYDGPHGNSGCWLCSNQKCKCRATCNRKSIPDLAIHQAVTRGLGLPEYDEELAKEEVVEVTSPEGGRLIVRFKDGSTYHDYYRGIYETVEKQPKNKNVFKRKIICGCCGAYYRCCTGYMGGGIRRATWSCMANRDNTMIHENVLKYRVAEALGWEEFSFERFAEKVEKIIMDRPCHMQIYTKEGEIKNVEYYGDGKCNAKGKKDDNDTSDTVVVSALSYEEQGET